MTEAKKNEVTFDGEGNAIEYAFDVFLSHSSKDKSVVRVIAERLRSDGIKVWFDEWCIRPGDSIFSKIEDGLKQSKLLVLCMSEASLGSDWATLEHQTVRFRDPLNQERRFVPLRLDETRPDGTLGQFSCIDWRCDDQDSAYLVLLEACRPLERISAAPYHTNLRHTSDIPPTESNQATNTGAIAHQNGQSLEVVSGPCAVADNRQRPLGNLPYHPMGNALFKGRGETIGALMKHFESGEAGLITQPQAIHGLGGVGKTRLAVEYAWKAWSLGHCDRLFFISGGSPESLMARFAALSQPDLLNLAAYSKGHDAALAAVLHCLSERQDWLLIIDNIDSIALQEVLKEQLLPQLPGGRILITSRLRDWWDGVLDFRIAPLNKEDGAAYLLEKTSGKRQAFNNDEAQARAISQVMDGLPVALEQAGAYINRLGLSFNDFLKIYEEKKKAVLGWDAKAATCHPLPVLAMWEATEPQLGLAERAVLKYLSCLAPAPVPLSLFDEEIFIARSCGESSSVRRGREGEEGFRLTDVRDSLGNLAAWSMVQIADATVNVHSMVQTTTVLRMSMEERLQAYNTALLFVTRSLSSIEPSYDFRSWSLWMQLEPHVRYLIDTAFLGISVNYTSHLMNEYGCFLYSQARYEEAEKYWNMSLKVSIASHGGGSRTSAKRYSNMAALFMETGRTDDAIDLIRRSIEIIERESGNDHPDMVISLGILGQLLLIKGETREAEPIIKRALSIADSDTCQDPLTLANQLDTMAAYLVAVGRSRDAVPFLRRALLTSENAFGPRHPDVAYRLHNLAASIARINVEDAIPLLERSYDILKSTIGEQHPNTLTVCEMLDHFRQRDLGFSRD